MVGGADNWSYPQFYHNINSTKFSSSLLGLSWPNGINPNATEITTTGNGAATIDRTMIVSSTGTYGNSISRIQSIQPVQFDQSTELAIRFGAVFSPPATNTNLQVVGMGNVDNGLFFGRVNGAFSVVHMFDGVQEVRTLTLGGPVTSTGQIAIELDGVTSPGINITSGDSVSQIASYISRTDFTNVGNAWVLENNGNAVVFTGVTAGSRTGTYSFIDVGETGAFGTFTETVQGVAPNINSVAQSAWNIDIGDDNTALATFDPTKGNNYEIKVSGGAGSFGRILYSIKSSYDGYYVPVHSMEFLNNTTEPILSQSRLPLAIFTQNDENLANVWTSVSHITAEIIPESVDISTLSNVPKYVVSSNIPNYTILKNVNTNVLSLRNNSTYNFQPNNLQVQLLSINYSYSGQRTLIFTISKNVTYTGGAYSYQQSSPTSVTSYFNQPSAPGVFTHGGVVLREWLVTNGTSTQFDMSTQQLFLNPGDELSVNVRPLGDSNAVLSDFGISILFLEG